MARALLRAAGVMGMVAVLAGSSCPPRFLRSDDPAAFAQPRPLPEDITADQLVDMMNDRAAKLHGIDAGDVVIRTKADGRSVPSLNGTLVCRKPLDFRLKGRKAFIPQVDIGSNSQEFWFWVRQSEEPLLYCSYTDYKDGVRLPFPFEPEWALQALGMAEYDPNGDYQVKVGPKYVFLIERTNSTRGQPIEKITVFDRMSPQAPPRPQVVGYTVKDASGIIAEASIKKVKETRLPSGEAVVYPRVVSLTWPRQKVTLELDLDDVTVNPGFSPSQESAHFRRPADLPSHNLALGLPARPSSRVRRAESRRPAGVLRR